MAKVSPEKPSEPSKGSAPKAPLNCERGRPPICPGWFRAPSPAGPKEEGAEVLPPRAGLPERTQLAAHSLELPIRRPQPRGEVRLESLGWEGGESEGETHLPSPGASFGVVPRCGPPPSCQVLSPAGRCVRPGLQASRPVPAGKDCKSTLLFELPLAPPHRSPPAGGSGALSRQLPRAGTKPGYHHACGRPLPRGCLRPGSYVCARVCIRVCVRERESVRVCASRWGELSPRGTRR